MLSFVQVTSDNVADCMRVYEAADAHDHPEKPTMLAQLMISVLENQHPFRQREWHVAYLEGEPVGAISLDRTLRENLHLLGFQLHVTPQRRRQGIGRRLHEFVLAQAAVDERRTLQTTCMWNMPGLPSSDEAGQRFALALGYQPALLDVDRQLVIAEVDQARLDSLHTEAVSKAEGYRTVRWVDSAPEEYVADVAYLDARVVLDIPLGELQLEAFEPDVERQRTIEQGQIARGRRTYHTGAVHEQSNRLVAWTVLCVEPGVTIAAQAITIVERGHRGHRLGALIKVENLRHLMASDPSVRVIDTHNALGNDHMEAINTAMGFRPVRAWQAVQREW